MVLDMLHIANKRLCNDKHSENFEMNTHYKIVKKKKHLPETMIPNTTFDTT